MMKLLIVSLLFAMSMAQTAGNVQVLLTGSGMTPNNINAVCTRIAVFFTGDGGDLVNTGCYFVRSDTTQLFVQVTVDDVAAAELSVTGTWFNAGDGGGADITAGVNFVYEHGDAYDYYINKQKAKECTVSNTQGNGMNVDCQTSGEPLTTQGAYCDSATTTDGGTTGRCVMCPPEGCAGAVSKFFIGSQSDCETFCNTKAVLASATVNTECTVQDRAANCGVAVGSTKTFCLGGSMQVCASCDLLDQPESDLACFDYPGFDFATSIGCVAICEGDEYSQQAQTDVNDQAGYVISELSDLEDSGDCPDAGCCSQGSGDFSGSGICTQGSSVSSFASKFSVSDWERMTDGCYSSRACGDPNKKDDNGDPAIPTQDVNKCYVNFKTHETPCTVPAERFDNGQEVEVPGRCIEGLCSVYPNFLTDFECPPHKPIMTTTPIQMRECTGDAKTASADNLRKTMVPVAQVIGSSEEQAALVGRDNSNVVCYSSSTLTPKQVTMPVDSLFDTMYLDVYAAKDMITVSYPHKDAQSRTAYSEVQGRCIIGSNMVPNSYFTGNGEGGMDPNYSMVDPNCVIKEDGFYMYRKQSISLIISTTPADCDVVDTSSGKPICTQLDTLVLIPYQTKFLLQVMACPYKTVGELAVCRGSIVCQFSKGMPCNGAYHVCSGTSGHGDPIIWTFGGECYDLGKDGMYSAAEHPLYDHRVEIAVHNDYMREIQVLDAEGNIWLSMNNMGEVINNDYPYAFSEVVKECPEGMYDCIDTYVEYEFDALDFSWVVEILRHDYNDNALKEGEFGYHLDIIPRPYAYGFNENVGEYTGLYFENPLPEELEYCPPGSPRT